MNEASLYVKVNVQSRTHTEWFLKKYAHKLRWRNDGRDALIDIGSGPGNTLISLVYPLMPKNFKELVGSDISEKMMNYASEHWKNDERTKYIVLDIATEYLPSELRGRFDHVTSFYALHWVNKQRKMFENIYGLLRNDEDGGDCLLLYLVKNFMFEVYEPLAKMPKWSKYMNDWPKFISPLQNSKDPVCEVREHLQAAGFVDCHVETHSEDFVYEGVELTRNAFKSISPFIDRIPVKDHEEHLNDMIKVMVSMGMRRSIEGSDDYNFVTPNELMIVYARKVRKGVNGGKN